MFNVCKGVGEDSLTIDCLMQSFKAYFCCPEAFQFLKYQYPLIYIEN